MFKNFLVKAAIVGLSASPFFSQACVEGNTAERQIERSYMGLTALPVAQYLGLDSTCDGRRLIKITMWASTSGGPGLATLLINGRPVGITTQITSNVSKFEFPLDIDDNVMGMGTRDMEIRMSGDFYVERLEATLSDAHPDPWANYGFFVGLTPLVGSGELTESTIDVSEEDGADIAHLIFIARHDDFFIKRVKLFLANGDVRKYGPAHIAKNEAARVDLSDCHCDKVTKIVIIGRADDECDEAQIEVRAKHHED
jgi:hypothetical protein